MDFIQSLRPEHLQSFWYSASKYNFALVGTFISLLWVTATEKTEADGYIAKLDEYRWVLRLSSRSADFLERAISMLATSTGVLVKAIPENPDPERILDQYQLRSKTHSSSVHRPFESIPIPTSIAYQSESEFHEDTSPENAIGGTPSDMEVASRNWNMDYSWFNSLNETNSGLRSLAEVSSENGFLGLDVAEQSLRFQ